VGILSDEAQELYLDSQPAREYGCLVRRVGF
jgi:hypothetical protein